MTNLESIKFRDMTVTDGMKSPQVVTAEAQRFACEKWLSGGDLSAGGLEGQLLCLGHREEAFRAADRLLQKLRKAGVIRWNGKVWERV